MCLNNRRGINPTSHYRVGLDRPFIMFPCGCCTECIQQQRNDWFIRSYGEYKHTQSVGGKVMFITLTYCNEDLPTFGKNGFVVLDKNGRDQSCFSKEHITSFIQKLKTYYSRLSKNGCEGFRYLVCCEYGHDYVYRDRNGSEHKGSARPHYHALLFFPASSKLISMKDLKSIAQKSWIYGFSLFSKESQGGAFVNNTTALRYVSKYISKDFGFYNLPHVKEAKEYLKKFAKEDEDVKNAYREFKRLLPRHYQSTNFGFEFLKYCFVDDIANPDSMCKYKLSANAREHISKGIKPELSEHYYKIPRYVFNKLCYQYKSEEDGGFRYLTPLGKQIMTILATENVAEKSSYLEKLMTPLGIHSFATDDEFAAVTHQDVYQYCANFWTLLGKRTMRDLVTYQLVYKDIVPELDWEGISYFDYYNNFTTKQYTDNALNFYIFRLDREKDTVVFHKHIFTNKKQVLTFKQTEAYYYTYNDLKAFKHFDTLLGMIDAVKRFRIRQLKAREIKENTIKEFKEKYT